MCPYVLLCAMKRLSIFCYERHVEYRPHFGITFFFYKCRQNISLSNVTSFCHAFVKIDCASHFKDTEWLHFAPRSFTALQYEQTFKS